MVIFSWLHLDTTAIRNVFCSMKTSDETNGGNIRVRYLTVMGANTFY
jgi:hypothetical protein